MTNMIDNEPTNVDITTTMRRYFEAFAELTVTPHLDNLMEYGEEEQVENIVQALTKFHRTTPVWPELEPINLFGFGTTRTYFRRQEDGVSYFSVVETGKALGMTPWDACAWAEREYGYALKAQREADEERGSLGYKHVRDYLNLNVWFIADDSLANPDAGGRRWSDYGDWLVSADRLMWFISCSPWQKEFVDNSMDLFAMGMRSAFGEKLDDLTAYHADGTPAPDAQLFATDLTEEEAIAKALRGPVIPES
jgi:hypothetical protein